MIGRETWKTVDKRLPGIYIRIGGYTNKKVAKITPRTMLADAAKVILKTKDGYYLAVPQE